MSAFLSVGECMVEIAPAEGGLYRLGFAGDTFNTAWYARRCLPRSWSVGFASAIGSDGMSEDMAAFIEREGLEISALRRIEGRTVGLYLIRLTDGERSFSYWRGQSAARSLADDPEWLAEQFRGRDIVHFSGITLAILPPAGRDALCGALAAARRAGTRIAFDTNIRPRLWEGGEALRSALLAGASVSDVILPSFDEERDAFGDASPEATIERYRALGASTVVVKNGADPILARSGERTVTVPPPPDAEVVDTTAAGDSFAAAFLAAEAQGAMLRTAVERAAALSAKVIERRGALAPDFFA